MQLAYCQKLDAEADPINKIKTIITIITIFPISKSIKFPFPHITQLKYCQKLDFEADPNHKFKPLKKLICSISKSII